MAKTNTVRSIPPPSGMKANLSTKGNAGRPVDRPQPVPKELRPQGDGHRPASPTVTPRPKRYL